MNDGVAYVGGQFYGFGVAGHDYVGAVDAVSGASLGWYPKPDADVHALAVSDAAVYVGGEFSSMWAWQRRNHLAALDVKTGALLPWDPNPDFVVGCMALSGNTLYVSGSFHRVGGQPRAAIAALDATTGLATEWNPGVTGYTSGPVWAMKLHRGTLYVGGYFSQVGGQARYCLAAIDSASGQVTAWNPGVDDIVEAIEARGDTLYLGGWFSRVGGSPRSCAAAVDTGGTVLSWNPAASDVVRSIAFGDSLVYVAGWFTQIGGEPRTQLAALDPAHGTATAWIADANERVVSIVVANGVLYAGGWFTAIGGRACQGLAAVSTDSARVLDWGPSLNGRALELLPSDDAIYVGGNYQHIAGDPRPGFAILSQYGVDWTTPPPAPPDRAALAQNVPNPATASTSVRFTLARGGAATLTIHDLAGRRIARPIREEWREPGIHGIELATGTWPPGIYYYRLSAPGVDVTRKMAVVR